MWLLELPSATLRVDSMNRTRFRASIGCVLLCISCTISWFISCIALYWLASGASHLGRSEVLVGLISSSVLFGAPLVLRSTPVLIIIDNGGAMIVFALRRIHLQRQAIRSIESAGTNRYGNHVIEIITTNGTNIRINEEMLKPAHGELVRELKRSLGSA
jgi:hypothetical protein